MTDRVVIGTRGSRLALIQAESVWAKLRRLNPGIDVDIQIIKTAGDKISSAPFAQVGSLGIFVREIEAALIDGRIDVAVHSLKDLQTELPDELEIGAITEREGARDALISRDGRRLDELPDGSVIGTSSARRAGIVAAEGRGFDIRECRGNVQRRIEKLREGQYDAIILAEAGLRRLGMDDEVVEYLDVRRFVPAVGQGALGIEIRKDDARIADCVKGLNHEPTYTACIEEREFLEAIGGGCHAPVGGHLMYELNEAVFLTFVGTRDGSWFVRKEMRVEIEQAMGVGLRMAEEIKGSDGWDEFFEETTREAG